MHFAACPACGQGHSEFDTRCPACGTPLPQVSGPSPAAVLAGGSPAGGEDPLVGRFLSHFRITKPLGRGGMGAVYLAVDLGLGREVALKFLAGAAGRTEQDDLRFQREAQATAALDHPNVGTVYEVGEEEGLRFIAMAYYAGETLAARLAREPERRLEPAVAAAVAGQLASALGAAHVAGVVHRDLKPENVMLLPDGRVKLLDFGLARWAEASGLTAQGMVVGTAAYMAPEQLRGEEADAAADLWALGAVLYEMLAGRRPFGGERRGMMHAILHEEPEPLQEVRPEVPPALAAIAQRCLEKEPPLRPASAAEVLAELSAAGLWSPGGSGSMPAPALRPRHRPWLWAAAAALPLLALVVYWRTRPPVLPLYVAVLKPAVTGPMPAAEQSMIASNLQGAVLRSLAGLKGVAALDPAQVTGVAGTPIEVARAVAAGEVVAAEAACGEDLCQVRLRRLSGGDGRVLWMDSLQVPPSRPRLFAEAVAASVRQAFPDRRPRFDRGDLGIEEADYRRYLELRASVARAEDLDAVLKELGALRARAPGFLEAFVLEAAVARRLYSDSGERRYLDHGVAVARQAMTLAPQDPRPLGSLFDLDLEAGHLAEAESVLDRLEAIDPASALLRRGQLAERRGEADRAVELATEAVHLHPSWRNLLTLANMEYRLGRLGAARRHLGELLQRSPGHAEGLRTLAQIELVNDPARAVELLRQLVAKRPEPGALTNLGLAYLLLRRYAEAEASFRRALELQPGDPSATLNLADCLTLLGRESEARPLYRGLLAGLEEGAPTLANWPLLSIKAQALAHLGETTGAIEAIQAALRLTPANAQLALEAAVVYALVGEPASAVVHARRARELGMDPRWFTFPWFDPLRSDPAFAALLTSSRPARSGPS